jgi:hypothetical protein
MKIVQLWMVMIFSASAVGVRKGGDWSGDQLPQMM